jgi:2-keto-4-pentenoate hydratase/2-oxohepta-3-ene-1,7-dioic acid hydratase in catechol pathway
MHRVCGSVFSNAHVDMGGERNVETVEPRHRRTATTVVIPPGGNVDWEVELVAVIGRPISRTDEAAAWSHVAG